ncbi:MAG: type II toxin-antitoxin system VapC family toxin [Methanosarcinales archaeon Met12]|nr:MAG: type II toxin-antitoxin system VapC family toxin [Methanosarcinales archaeon Met12]
MGIKLDYEKVGLDTMVFIYQFEAHPEYGEIVNDIFDKIEKGEIKAVTSTITVAEILTKPMKDGNEDAVRDYKYVLQNFPNLEIVPITFEIAEQAASLRAKYGLRVPDVIQIAVCLANDAQAFVTNDARLRKVNEVDIVLLCLF